LCESDSIQSWRISSISPFHPAKPKVFDLRLRFRISVETIGTRRVLFNTTQVVESSKESQSLTALSCVA
jgi:hypothetical protein